MGMGAAWCASFAALHLGGYANQILMQFPNIVVFYGGLSTVFLMPIIEKEFEAYETNELAEEAEKKRLNKERRLQETQISIKKRFGKNSILRGLNFEDGATAKERNNQIGGHKA
jgi:hypothetical protein